ncbi:transposase [Methylocaldum sp. RMAD-M]|uniref:transposase n=1 Tax=Methylocaldum sp. RMAD-M TaxID=2806557 RepID=UPI001AE13E0A|nr:transposase [Methylocaldum sp. RMAD-M]MBP1152544.1 transposase-like protein [Methylocaldum sp. RMAD-M]
MAKLPRQSFTAEFREQAVKLVSDEKLTLPEAARRLGMSAKTLTFKDWAILIRRFRDSSW